MTKENTQLQKTENNPNALMELAVKNNASIEHLERLMDLQERWEKNQSRKAFYNAKAKFQSKKPVIKKTQTVEYPTSKGKTKYSFAPLSQIQHDVDSILAELGLSYDYKQVEENGKITITCVLSHELGHSEETSLSAPHDTSGGKNAIQGIGSTVTYLKRYTLSNAIGLSTEEDNDGASTMTAKEANELKLKCRLMELFVAKRDVLKDEHIERLNEVIATDEVASYQKIINKLKTL